MPLLPRGGQSTYQGDRALHIVIHVLGISTTVGHCNNLVDPSNA